MHWIAYEYYGPAGAIICLIRPQENFVPGEVIVHFKPEVIDFPVGSDRKPFSEVSILDPQARVVLEEIATSESVKKMTLLR